MNVDLTVMMTRGAVRTTQEQIAPEAPPEWVDIASPSGDTDDDHVSK
jgi:hypothetical protein